MQKHLPRKKIPPYQTLLRAIMRLVILVAPLRVTHQRTVVQKITVARYQLLIKKRTATPLIPVDRTRYPMGPGETQTDIEQPFQEVTMIVWIKVLATYVQVTTASSNTRPLQLVM